MKHICDTKRDYIDCLGIMMQGDVIYCSEELWKEITEVRQPYFLPPWDMNEFPEKTEGWIEFQKAMDKNPEYYLCKY